MISDFVTRRRAMAVTLAVLGGMGAIFFLPSDLPFRREALAISAVISGVATGSLLMYYLQGPFKGIQPARPPIARDERNDGAMAVLEHRMVQVDHQLQMMQHRLMDAIERQKNLPSQEVLEDDQKKSLVASIVQRVQSEASTELLQGLREQIAANDTTAVVTKHASERFTLIVRRLRDEVDALSRRGNLNLVLGILTTAIGLGALSYFVIKFPVDGTLFTPALISFVPRLSLVVFIELFAYFFLRLYKSTLSEIKYFQNELTNIESKAIALEVCTMSGSDTAAASVIEKIAGTERNHVLEAGQTTIELEQAKLRDDKLADFLKEILPLVKSEPGKK